MADASHETGRPSKRVTHADVARASGVSRATVSYVLNDVPGKQISERTRELVLSKARELGHLPFAPARSLRLGRSDVVLALVGDFGLGYVSNHILADLDTALAARGYLVIVHRFDASLRSIPKLWGAVTPALVVSMGGMLVPDSDQQVIEGTGTKFLRLHGDVDHRSAGSLQVSYLVEKGHRLIGYAYPSAANVQLVARERFEGAAHRAAALGIDELGRRPIDVEDPSTVTAAVEGWLQAGTTAVCAHNDEIAIMIVEALHDRGVDVGAGGVAVIGNDDIPAGRMNLTTIRIDAAAWSRDVVDSVTALLDGTEQEVSPRDYLQLVVRSSA